jgi:hypothetical protein
MFLTSESGTLILSIAFLVYLLIDKWLDRRG